MAKQCSTAVVSTGGEIERRPLLFFLVIAALCVVQALFAGLAVAGKLALNNSVHPLVFAFCREAVAGPFLVLLGLMFERASPKREDFFRLILLGLTGVYLNQMLVFLGLLLTTPLTVALMQCLVPVICSAMALSLQLERPTALKLLGILCAVIGAAVMIGILEAFKQWERRNALGILCLLGNTTATAGYIILQRPLNVRYLHAPLSLTGWTYCIGSCATGLTLALYCLFIDYRIFNNLTWSVVPLLAYAVFGGTVATYFLITFANARAPSTLVSGSWCLQPVFAAVLGIIFISAIPTSQQLIGGGFVLVGLVMVIFEQRRQQQQHQQPQPILAPEQQQSTELALLPVATAADDSTEPQAALLSQKEEQP